MPEAENEGAVATASVPTGNGDVSHSINFLAYFLLTLIFSRRSMTGGTSTATTRATTITIRVIFCRYEVTDCPCFGNLFYFLIFPEQSNDSTTKYRRNARKCWQWTATRCIKLL